MLYSTQSYCQELDDGLILRSVADERDVERIAAFNAVIHGPGVADMTRELILHHPRTHPEHWIFVEDKSTQQVVSALCLIPWMLRYEQVEILAGEVGIVGTLEAYRRRGLIRAQFSRHEELLRQGEYDVGMIQGIPYFYRQFGYEYAMPLEGGWHVGLHQIPDPRPDEPSPFHLRPAEIEDVPALMAMYDQAAKDLSISATRDEATWRFLLGPSSRTEMVAETLLVVDRAGASRGYVRVPRHGFGEGLIVNEASRLDVPAAEAVFAHLKLLAQQRNKPYIRLCLPAHTILVRLADHRGAHNAGHYAWQIHLVDVGRLLHKLAPVLEKRLADSPFSGLDANVCLNLYRETWELCFRAGKLVQVNALGLSNRADIRLPPLLAAPLLLGYRDREELSASYPDTSFGGRWGFLADTLFPKVSSFIYTTY